VTQQSTVVPLERLFQTAVSSLDFFFFHPVSSETLRLTGYLRIFLALIFLYDQAIWTLDRTWLMSPRQGILKFNDRFEYLIPEQLTLFELAPDNEAFFWAVHYGGIVCGILLLLGIAPRLSLLGVYASIVSFNHLAPLPTDGQDDLFRVWTFWFFFLPLHHVTIYDVYDSCFGGTNKEKQRQQQQEEQFHVTWSMWPYRFAQFQTIYVYVGASWYVSYYIQFELNLDDALSWLVWMQVVLQSHEVFYCIPCLLYGRGKLAGGNKSWIQGLEIWRALHGHIFCMGPWQPDWLLNTLMPLKLLCWLTLFVESVCIFTVWPLTTRNWTVWALVMFHIGIDITMNMHILELLCILGWLFFLARPALDRGNDDEASKTRPPTTKMAFKHRYFPRWMASPIIAFFLLGTWAQTDNVNLWVRTAPRSVKPILESYLAVVDWVFYYTNDWLIDLGCYQSKWQIFPGSHLKTSGEGYSWFAYIDYVLDEGTDIVSITSDKVHTLTWASPDWYSMPWWKLKRHQRTMLFFENLPKSPQTSSDGKLAGYRGLCQKLYDNYSEGVHSQSILPGTIEIPENMDRNVTGEIKIVSITLQVEISTGPLYPSWSIGHWTVPAIELNRIKTEARDLYFFTSATNRSPTEECERRADQGDCKGEATERIMWKDCVQTCARRGFFNLALVAYPGSRILYGKTDITSEPFVVLGQNDDGRFSLKHEKSGKIMVADLFRDEWGFWDDDEENDGEVTGAAMNSIGLADNAERHKEKSRDEEKRDGSTKNELINAGGAPIPSLDETNEQAAEEVTLVSDEL
jgi:hypothetical protein